MDSRFKKRFQRDLLRWYQKHKRDLPWRRTRDPYAIWVSEIMLQQTQVNTVLPYYEKFLKRFPTLEKLARASEETVLAHWAGLGYYRRAKLLHRGAKEVLNHHQGHLPQTAQQLKQLPSIGDYTAGAIASIAFGQPAPLVDGNVIRVYSRVFAKQGHAKAPELQKAIWQIAKEMIPSKSPGDFNQALMELGATLCRVAMPTCERCPVQDCCQAYQQGSPETFPETPPKTKTLRLHRVVALGERGQQILLVKRKKPRWFQGMWELPHDYFENGSAAEEVLQNFLKEALGVSLKNTTPLPKTQHSITHHRITTHAWQGQLQGRLRKNSQYETVQFVNPAELDKMALPNFDRKVLNFFQRG